MTEHQGTQGEHGDHGGIHMPDPSWWPFIAGAGALAIGLALVWWSRDRNNEIAGPLLGATLLLVLIAGVGWAHEDSRMKRKAEGGEVTRSREARFTQVITFAINEGRMVASRLNGGILHSLSGTDNALSDLPGFQDMRIIASPAAAGPSQVLVETTWADREGLATYEETRRTLLDLVAAHPEDVVPGSVQVFDMEVVRDTKPVGFSFGLPAAAGLLGSLIVFGFMVGAGLNLFDNNATEGGESNGGGTTAPPAGNVITATDNKFDKTAFEAPPNTDVTFEFKNGGKVKHNIHFLDRAGGSTLAPGGEGAIIDGGASENLSFKTPGAGSYYFQCDLHPDQMKGTLAVKEGAPVPGAAPAEGGGGGAPGLTATDNKFDKASVEAAAGKEFTLTFKNNGKVKHNIHFLDKKGGNTLVTGAEGKIIDGGQSEEIKFTPPAAGTFYYQCDLHPDQMSGNFVVK